MLCFDTFQAFLFCVLLLSGFVEVIVAIFTIVFAGRVVISPAPTFETSEAAGQV